MSDHEYGRSSSQNINDTTFIMQEDDNMLANQVKQHTLIQQLRITRSSQFRRNPFRQCIHKSTHAQQASISITHLNLLTIKK